MALFIYGLKRTREEDEVFFPDSCGELSKIVTSSGIKKANNEVMDVLNRGS